MKKHVLSVFAIVLGLGLSAFTNKEGNVKKTSQIFYWYTADGTTSLGAGELPNNGCEFDGTGCAKGFVNPPSDPINDPAQRTLRNN